jgi:6-pyruvoyltetrahydropterin/6-carboxytetrahydropterin synthase
LKLARRCVFSASHRLWRSDWDAEKNCRVFGARASPHSHGHNYTLEVVVEGEPDRESGMVLDLKLLKDRIAVEVEQRFDHKDLNDDTPYFRDRPPTAEHVAAVIFDLLAGALGPHRLVAVRLSPDERLTVEVSP